jgi:tRNA(adenine34) deaminase
MCAGAIVNSRIKRVVFGAKDSRFGAMGGSFDLLANDLNHKPIVENGLFEDECEELMKEFFKKLRSR